WYPVLGTHGFVAASEYGAINFLSQNHSLHIWLSPTRAFNDTLVIVAGNTTVYRKLIHAKPLTLFTDSVDTDANPDSLVATLGNHLLTWSASPTAGDLARPVDAP